MPLIRAARLLAVEPAVSGSRLGESRGAPKLSPTPAVDTAAEEIPRRAAKGSEQVEQVANGRFVAGVSGNPAGRPPRRAPESALEAALAGLAGAMPEAAAANIARVAAGRAPLPPPSGVGRGENGWQRLLRLVPDAELEALAAMDRGELATLATSLGGSLDENEP